MVMRLHEDDFASGTERGVGPDWPIDYADLRPYYAAAERELGVAGASDNPYAPPREEPHPMPAFEPSYSDSLFAEACEELEIDMHSVPNARNSEAYDGRSACVGYGTCQPVCPAGAKYDATVHIERAEEKGATVIDRAPVQRLEHDADRITAAVYATPDGEEYRQEADAFVVACGGVETPRLLLLSSRTRTPTGWRTPAGRSVSSSWTTCSPASAVPSTSRPDRTTSASPAPATSSTTRPTRRSARSSWSFSTTLAPRRSRRR